MQRVYAAAHLPEAHLVRGLLNASGIAARIFNEFAPGGLGDLPAASVFPEVWVENDRDFERARCVIERYERECPTTGHWTCSGCGEANPAGFEICWRCQKSL